MELILTMLGETSTKEIAVKRDAQGLYDNAQAARAGGNIAGSTRKQIEEQTGQEGRLIAQIPRQEGGSVEAGREKMMGCLRA